MKRQKILFMIALLCTIVQGTRAQNYDVWDGTTTTVSLSKTPLPATASGAAKHKEIPRGSRRMAATSAAPETSAPQFTPPATAPETSAEQKIHRLAGGSTPSPATTKKI